MALDTEVVTVTPMRAAIARRMQASNQDVPQFDVTGELAMDAALDHLAALNRAGDAPRVTVGALLARASALALREHPLFNAVWTPDGLALATQVNLSVAVAVEGGLVAPALLDADQLSLSEIAAALSDLTSRARTGRLRGGEFTDGTFTLSNLGMFDVTAFSAIVTPPQVGILATGKIEQRPVWRNDGVAPAFVMTATLTSDHRAVDGADAARFLQTLRELVEEPNRLSRGEG